MKSRRVSGFVNVFATIRCVLFVNRTRHTNCRRANDSLLPLNTYSLRRKLKPKKTEIYLFLIQYRDFVSLAR